MEEPNVQKLIVDANGFIKDAKLQKIGREIFTLKDVVSEIRDSATRQRLQVLPYQLIFTAPTAESLRHVTEFSKKTGDYPSLSATDLRLIALTYQLEVESAGGAHLKSTPQIESATICTGKTTADPRNIVGFHVAAKTNSEDPSRPVIGQDLLTGKRESGEEPVLNDGQGSSPSNEESKSAPIVESAEKESHSDVVEKLDELAIEENDESSDSEPSASDEEGEDSSDGEGDWITPENLDSALAAMGGEREKESGPIAVACMTSDFAMQNVMLHMGLKVVSLDGMLAKKLRTYILRCYGCFTTTSVMTKKFCPACGNATLKRVSVRVDPVTGEREILLSKRVQLTGKGKKFSLPMPKGGKHGFDPIVCEDQRIPHNRLGKKALRGVDPMSPDYVAQDSPFSLRDTNSRAALLGVGNHSKTVRKNPNKGRGKKRGGKRS